METKGDTKNTWHKLTEDNALRKQNMIDELKFAKILYLADVLEDISVELGQRMHSHHDICKSIDGIVNDLRDTVKNNQPDPMLVQQKVVIKRLETKHMADMMVPLDRREEYEKIISDCVENELLGFIKKNKLIRVRRLEDEHNIPMFVASLIVAIEKDADIPRREPGITFLDKLAKNIDEK